MLSLRQRLYWVSGAILLIISIPLVVYAADSTLKADTSDIEIVVLPETKEVKVEKTETVEDIIKRYSAEYSVPESLTIAVARCESGLNPSSKNSHSSATGIFQFLTGTWISTRNQMGLDSSPALRLNAEENIKTGIWKIAHGGLSAWSESKGCWSTHALGYVRENKDSN